ncbi:MAG: NUDIX hydrolase [Anaerolineaceae bacterium]
MLLPQQISIEYIQTKISQIIPAIKKDQKNLAAVQILIIENTNFEVILTKRSIFVQNHKNEISFPGGAVEREDENIYETALRETCEEINICKRSIRFLGSLAPFVTHYGLEIYPFIGSISEFEFMQAAPNWEVQEIFTIPLEWFFHAENLETKIIESGIGVQRKVSMYKTYHEHIVWGITAEIIKDFIQKLTN